MTYRKNTSNKAEQMSSPRPERCEHEPCGFNQRPEYCIEPLDDKRELGWYLAEEIEALLYEGTEYSHEHIGHRDTGDMRVTTRRLEIFSAADLFDMYDQRHLALDSRQGSKRIRTWVERSTIEIERIISSAQETYLLSSRARNLDTSDDNGVMQYMLCFGSGEDEYSGRVTCDEYVLLEGHPELRSRRVKDREMSNYDYEQLFDLLWKVHQVHGLEGASNARSEDWLNQLDW